MTNLRRILWSVTIAYWVMLFVATHVPPVRLPGTMVSDKTQHFVAYAVLTLMAGVTLWMAFPARRWIGFLPLFSVLGAAAYGAFDEITQPITGRTRDFRDWVADCGGALLAAGLLLLLQRIARLRAEPPAGPSAPAAVTD
jgi:VanZ family protein